MGIAIVLCITVIFITVAVCFTVVADSIYMYDYDKLARENADLKSEVNKLKKELSKLKNNV